LNTLKYSSIAKKIKNRGVRSNVKVVMRNEVMGEDYKEGELMSMKKERIRELLNELIY
jgi:hypothetical protein